VYHAISLFPNGNHGKRDTTVCAFLVGSDQHFGRIVQFVNMPIPQALVRKFHQPSVTAHACSCMHACMQAGPPCQPVLAVYKDVDLLRSFFTVIEERCATPLRLFLSQLFKERQFL
jgi:hypothetical protein